MPKHDILFSSTGHDHFTVTVVTIIAQIPESPDRNSTNTQKLTSVQKLPTAISAYNQEDESSQPASLHFHHLCLSRPRVKAEFNRATFVHATSLPSFSPLTTASSCLLIRQDFHFFSPWRIFPLKLTKDYNFKWTVHQVLSEAREKTYPQVPNFNVLGLIPKRMITTSLGIYGVSERLTFSELCGNKCCLFFLVLRQFTPCAVCQVCNSSAPSCM